jgi:hypothetical protein
LAVGSKDLSQALNIIDAIPLGKKESRNNGRSAV